MQYRNMGALGWEASVLGFGAMRLPVDRSNGEIDYAKATEMVRFAIDNGVNYIDTAFLYHNEQSEVLLGKALKDEYREKIKLVSKSPVWLMKTKEDFTCYFNKQLKSLDTDFLDIYLLHGLNLKKWEKVKQLDLIGEMEKLKTAGKIRHIGFSFHDSFEVFKEIVDSYSWEVVLLQYNYLDTDFEVTSRGIDYAYSKNIPVVVMEPLKGGKLIQHNPEIDEILIQAKVTRSLPEWALRFVWNHPGVKCVLSGMNNLEQVKENLKIAENASADSLSDEDLKTIQNLKECYASRIKIQCTSCRYCMPCPQGVDIPENFNLLNNAVWEGKVQKWIQNWYNDLGDEGMKTDWHGKGKASLCTQCGECLDKCPQKIDIPEALIQVRQIFEEGIALEKI
jgi:predicted aldo/keto reductase-like oxidoreductase